VWNPEVRASFLLALQRSGSVNAAAAAVGIYESVVRYHRDHDEEFAAECKRAMDLLAEELMGVVREHAVRGVITKEVRNDTGAVVVRERRYSERLLLAWLRKQESGSWTERVAVDQKHSGTVEHKHSGRIEVEHYTPEQRRKAREFLASFEVVADGS